MVMNPHVVITREIPTPIYRRGQTQIQIQILNARPYKGICGYLLRDDCQEEDAGDPNKGCSERVRWTMVV